MSTPTLTPSESVTVAELNLPDDKYKCTHRSGCDRDASWWTDCTGCGAVDYACTPHKQEDERIVAGWLKRRRNPVCSVCDTSIPNPTDRWKPL
jgi:hypothetical protein